MLYDYRYRLNIEAKVTPNTIGFVQLDGSGETSTDDNGEMGSPDNPSNIAEEQTAAHSGMATRSLARCACHRHGYSIPAQDFSEFLRTSRLDISR